MKKKGKKDRTRVESQSKKFLYNFCKTKELITNIKINK